MGLAGGSSSAAVRTCGRGEQYETHVWIKAAGRGLCYSCHRARPLTLSEMQKQFWRCRTERFERAAPSCSSSPPSTACPRSTQPHRDRTISQSSTMSVVVWEQSRVADSRLGMDFHCQSHTSNTELLIDPSTSPKWHSQPSSHLCPRKWLFC